MKISSTTYEKLVMQMAKKIARSKDIQLIDKPKYGRKNRIAGKSSINHQIDVSVPYESKDGVCRLKLAECKLRSKDKIGLGIVIMFHARIMDIQKQLGDSFKVEGNLFTTIGYTAPAKIFADFYGIATNSYQEDSQAWSITFKDETVIQLRTI